MRYLLMIVLLCTVTQARAGFLTGNVLLENCEMFLRAALGTPLKTDSFINSGMCPGYIAGIVDVEDAFVGWGRKEKAWCTPSTTHGQLVRVVTKYLQERPEKLHLNAGSLVANALILAFPCE